MGEENLKALKELILDENRLVTYISVSKELCIHVNEAKHMLCTAVEDIRKTRSDVLLNISYVVSGLLNNNSARTVVCSEKDKSTIKSSMKQVFFDHIYCVGQGVNTVDTTGLALINKISDYTLCKGLIKGNYCIKRSSSEITALKTNSQHAINVNDIKSNNTATKEKNNATESAKPDKNPIITPELKSETRAYKKSDVLSPKKEVKVNKQNDKSNGIASFFNKSNKTATKQQNTDNLESDKKIIEKIQTKVKTEPMAVDNDKTEKNNHEELTNNIVTTTKINNNHNGTGKNKQKPIDAIKKNAKLGKKRKRVLQVSDSDSDDGKNDPFAEEATAQQESEDEIPPTPLPNSIKITSGIINPKKKRKVIDKTYLDDEGYIHTKKEEVYESCSDNEGEPNIKQEILQKNNVKTEISPTQNKGKNTKKKVSPPQKGKQVSLFNYFTKK